MQAIRKILVAVDFGEASDAALEAGLDLAAALDAEVVVLHAYEPPQALYGGAPFMPPPIETTTWYEQAAKAGLEAAVERAKSRLPGVTGILRVGTPWRAIVDAGDSLGVGLVVIGTHGRTGLPRALLGSVAEKVVRMSAVPVLTVHAALEPHGRVAEPERSAARTDR